MSEEYKEPWTWTLWPDGLAKERPLSDLPRIDFSFAADPVDRYLALVMAFPTPGEFRSMFMPDPIPLSERKPEPEDLKNGHAWYGQQQPFSDQDTWDWCYIKPLYGEGSSFTHWLPASTKFLPARVDQ